MRRGYFTPPVLIILAVIIFAVAILIALNTDLVKRLKNEPPSPPVSSPTLSSPPTTQQSSPTPDETANWKTYTNQEWGYSIQYPNDWEAKEYIKPNHSFEVSKGEDFVGVFVNYEEVSCGSAKAQLETVKISEYNGEKISCLNDKTGQLENTMLFFRNINNNSYLVIGDLNYQKSSLVPKILSTFKFIE